jgi:hypothetical protein
MMRLKTALEEQATEHESDIAGLKTKNKELLTKLKAANEGKDSDPAEVARLEGELEKAQKDLKAATKERDANAKLLETSPKVTLKASAVLRLRRLPKMP